MPDNKNLHENYQPQDSKQASSIDEIIDWIGGDQPCVLTPASLKRFGVQPYKHEYEEWRKNSILSE